MERSTGAPLRTSDRFIHAMLSKEVDTAILTYFVEGGGKTYQMEVKLIKQLDEDNSRRLILSVTNSEARTKLKSRGRFGSGRLDC